MAAIQYNSEYINQMAKHELLTQAEEISLAKEKDCSLALLERGEPFTVTERERLATGEQAQEKLVKRNIRLVIALSTKFVGHGVDFDDLFQAGIIGLMSAIKKYEWRRGYRFSTCATWWIRQAMDRTVADHSRTIRLPAQKHGIAKKITAVSDFLSQSLGRDPTLDEIGAEVNLTPEKVKKIMEFNSTSMPVSLDQDHADEDNIGYTLLSLMDEGGETASESAERTECVEIISDVLRTLSPREARIIELRYGLNGCAGKSHTLEEVGQKFNLTRERIRQIEAGALRKLRHPRRARNLREFLQD